MNRLLQLLDERIKTCQAGSDVSRDNREGELLALKRAVEGLLDAETKLTEVLKALASQKPTTSPWTPSQVRNEVKQALADIEKLLGVCGACESIAPLKCDSCNGVEVSPSAPVADAPGEKK